jgi:hypothetical protein
MYDRRDAQFEFLNRFDSALFVHCSTPTRKNKRLTLQDYNAKQNFVVPGYSNP